MTCQRGMSWSLSRRRSVRLLALVAAGAFAIVGLPSESGVAYAAFNSETQCIDDGSISVQTCITIEWNDAQSGGTHYVELTSVRAHVVQLDRTVNATKLEVGAVVQGRCESGCQTKSAGELLKSKTTPTYRTNYGGPPSWSNVFVSVAGGGLLYNCGVFQTNLKGHGTTWSYTGDLCIGSSPDSLSVSDRERGLD
jgi:hypothetical protein